MTPVKMKIFVLRNFHAKNFHRAKISRFGPAPKIYHRTRVCSWIYITRRRLFERCLLAKNGYACEGLAYKTRPTEKCSTSFFTFSEGNVHCTVGLTEDNRHPFQLATCRKYSIAVAVLIGCQVRTEGVGPRHY